jgi:hypothetical protein
LPRRRASSLAPNHKVLCHSRSPFITTVTLVRCGSAAGLVCCRAEEGLGIVELPIGLGSAAGVVAFVGCPRVQAESMINKLHETAASRARALLKSEPSQTRQPR